MNDLKPMITLHRVACIAKDEQTDSSFPPFDSRKFKDREQCFGTHRPISGSEFRAEFPDFRRVDPRRFQAEA